MILTAILVFAFVCWQSLISNYCPYCEISGISQSLSVSSELLLLLLSVVFSSSILVMNLMIGDGVSVPPGKEKNHLIIESVSVPISLGRPRLARVSLKCSHSQRKWYDGITESMHFLHNWQWTDSP